MANNKKTSIDLMDKEIMKILETYGDKATSIVREETQASCKKAVKMLKEKSPKNTGRYKKGWSINIANGYAGADGVVYNKTSYQLTHLLENGHKTADGGDAPAKPHIGEVNEEIQTEFLSNVTKRLKQ